MTEILKGAKTVSQWSRITGIPYNALRISVQVGRLPGYQFKPRGQIYITPDAIEKFLEQARVRPVLQEVTTYVRDEDGGQDAATSEQ